jgi:hypothetical protein
LIQQLRQGKQHSLLLDGGDEVTDPVSDPTMLKRLLLDEKCEDSPTYPFSTLLCSPIHSSKYVVHPLYLLGQWFVQGVCGTQN